MLQDFRKLSHILNAAHEHYPDNRLPTAFVGVLDNHPKRRFNFDLFKSVLRQRTCGRTSDSCADHLRAARSGHDRKRRDPRRAAGGAILRRDLHQSIEVLDELRRRQSRYAESTIRTHIVSRMCANAPDNHATTTSDLIRVAHGLYRAAS